MNQIELKLEELVDSIQHSEEYQDYQTRKQEIDKDPDLRARLHEFQRRQYELQEPENGSLFDESAYLEKEFGDLLKHPGIREYLDAEVALCKMYRTIDRRVIEAIRLDVEF